MQNVDEIIDALTTIGRRKTPSMVWKMSLFYFTSIMLSRYNIRKSVGQRQEIQFFSLLFASSGLGKSYTLSTVEKMFKFKYYPEAMMAFYEDSISHLPDQPSEYNDVKRYMPKSVTSSLEGSKEGLYYLAYAQNASNYGSLNLYSEEIGDIITGSADMLGKMKEMFDGIYKAKIVKGSLESEIKPDIQGIVCNMIAVGTRSGIKAEDAKELHRVVSSGIYRRSWILEVPQNDIEKNTTLSKEKEVAEYIAMIDEHYKTIFKAARASDLGNTDTIIDVTEEYKIRLEEVDQELIDRSNNDKLDSFKLYDTGSLEIIINLSYILGILELSSKIEKRHLNQAYTFFIDTRTSVAQTFQSVHPYRAMYDMLKKRNNMTISEMAEIDNNIPIMKSKIQDNVDLLSELCYRHDEVLTMNKGKVVRFSIDKLPENDLTKLIVSVHDEDDGQYAVNFKPFEISWETLTKIVTSSKIQSFCAAQFEPSAKAPDGHRKSATYISGTNLIVFDIDDGMSLERASSLLQQYKYMIYTTKSHKSEKSNGQDRYRIILPTKTTFYIEPDQYKDFYSNVENFLNIDDNDAQTKNASRIWSTNNEAEVFQNEGDLFDATPFLPNTEKSDTFLPKFNAIDASYDISETSRRITGMIKHSLIRAVKGFRNETLYNLGMFVKDMGEDAIDTVERTNAMISEPLAGRDLKDLLASLSRS